jgi:hypothetical protein
MKRSSSNNFLNDFRKMIKLFSYTGQWVAIVMISLFFPVDAFAESLPKKWGPFVAGGFSSIVIHELGHIVVAESLDVNYKFEGLTITYPNSNLTDSEHLRISSAGFQAQWIASEIAFMSLDPENPISPTKKSYIRGIVAGHAAITFAYLTILKDHEDGDIEGMSQASGISNNKLAMLVAIPAILDSWRMFAKDVPSWVPRLSVAFKSMGIGAIWTF